MKSLLKKLFIPTEGNNHRPHFLRSRNVIQIIGILVFFELVLFILPTFNFVHYSSNLHLSSVLPGVLGTLTNEERMRNNLSELRVNPLLTQAAQLKAEDMAAKGYFAHTSPEGKTPWHWFSLVGYSYQFAGENLAVNFSDSERVTEAWMNSPTHRANVVGKAYKEMGTGVATGTYKGKSTVFVAQVYGTPRTGSQLLGTSHESIPTWKYLASSPSNTVNAIMYTVLSLMIVALFLNVMIKFKYQYSDLIRNGIIVILIIIGLQIFNEWITSHQMETSFIEFPAQEAIL